MSRMIGRKEGTTDRFGCIAVAPDAVAALPLGEEDMVS